MWYALLLKFKKIFLKGGADRMKFTLPALVFSLFKLSAQIEMRGVSTEPTVDEDGMQLVRVDHNKIFKAVHELVGAIQDAQPVLSMKLYLQGCQAINRIQDYTPVEELAYEFASAALLIYQDDITDSEEKARAINLICCTLHNLHCFSQENHATLLSNAVASCAHLLKKPAQCEAIINASNLFNTPYKQDGKRVMDQLKKALKICDVCMTSAKNLYPCVELLNKYLYYYIYEATFMTADDVNNMIDFINE